MNIKKLAVTSALVIAAMGITAGTANAAPAPADAPAASTQAQQAINYTVARAGDAVLVTTDAGSITTSGNQLEVRDGQGNVVTGVPLTYQLNGQAFPIAAQVNGNTATLTPSVNPAQATAATDIALPLSDVDLPAAVASVKDQISLAASVGGIVGAIVAGGTGCILGAVALTAATIPLAALLGAGPVAGCLAGAVMLAPVGALGGAIFVGGPVVLASAFQFAQVLQAPPVKK